MKDIPIFNTEYGVASLVLKEIPYQETAYIIIRDSLEPEKLLEECVGFCRACGAEKIYATGHTILENRPLLTAIWEMRRDTAGIPDTDAAIWSVQEQTLGQWRQIYNQKVVSVPNGAWMTEADGKQMLQKGDGYFVHRGDELLGIGRAFGDRIDAVIAAQPGMGADVVLALCHALTADTAVLEVASGNPRAIRLYQRLGFTRTGELSRWFRVV